MPVLKEQIASRVKGALMEREDWWYLCYDTDTGGFFVEHKWDHVNAYKIGSPDNSSGVSKHDVATWNGEGSDRIEDAKAALLRKAAEAKLQ